MAIVIRLIGLVLVAMGCFTLYFAHKHGRLEPWSISGAIGYVAAGVASVLFASWWPILAGVLLGAGISSFGGVAQDRR